MRWSWNYDGARKWRESLRLKWAYHLRWPITELGQLLAAGLGGEPLKFIVRNMSAVAEPHELKQAFFANLLAVLG